MFLVARLAGFWKLDLETSIGMARYSQDMGDAAVAYRARVHNAGGPEVAFGGFRRGQKAKSQAAAAPAADLTPLRRAAMAESGRRTWTSESWASSGRG